MQSTKRIALMFLALCGCLGIWTYVNGHHGAKATLAPSVGRITLQYTGTDWYGKPVYKLTNLSDVPVQRIVLKNWSQVTLPYLYIGQHLSTSQIHARVPLSTPPYTVEAGDSLWFVGTTKPPARFILMWNEGSHHPLKVAVLYVQ
jgi:hypothetical protein